eukprot:scaffold12605_cov114-Isochrysis_galbana.AAC.10
MRRIPSRQGLLQTSRWLGHKTLRRHVPARGAPDQPGNRQGALSVCPRGAIRPPTAGRSVGHPGGVGAAQSRDVTLRRRGPEARTGYGESTSAAASTPGVKNLFARSPTSRSSCK